MNPPWVTVLRYMLAAVLVSTELGKLRFAYIVASYRVLPDALSFAAGTALRLTELGLAVWLLSGWRLAWAASLAALLRLLNRKMDDLKTGYLPGPKPLTFMCKSRVRAG